MKKTFFVMIAFFIIISNTSYIHAESLNLDAKAYILIDANSGKVLKEFNSDQKLYPASTTKVLTAVLALEMGDPDQVMEASEAAVYDIGPDGMNIGIMPGEKLLMKDLLNALLIRSANETANIIAENIAPTRQEFVDLMNKKASELGATNTHFANPCGSHDPEHYTTASDLSKIARYAMSIPKFKEIVGQSNFTMHPTNKHPKWYPIYTTNKLLGLQSEYYDKITGIKTGYTGPAGFNLVSSAVGKDGMELIAVILGAQSGTGTETGVYGSSRELLEYGFKNYSLQKLVDENQPVKQEQVSNSENNSPVTLVTSMELKAVLPVKKNLSDIVSEEHINASLKAPINRGDVLGYIEYKDNGVSLGKVNLIASNTVSESVKSKITGKNLDNHLLRNTIIIISAVLIGFIILRTVLRKISRRRYSRKYYKKYYRRY